MLIIISMIILSLEVTEFTTFSPSKKSVLWKKARQVNRYQSWRHYTKHNASNMYVCKGYLWNMITWTTKQLVLVWLSAGITQKTCLHHKMRRVIELIQPPCNVKCSLLRLLWYTERPICNGVFLGNQPSRDWMDFWCFENSHCQLQCV